MSRTKIACLSALLVLLSLAPARAQDGPFGAITRADGAGRPYALTAEDALWAARMITGESGGAGGVDDAAVLWCMINSYTLRPVRDVYPTFSAFVRAYCTPLQPHLEAQGAIDRHRRRGTPMVEVAPGKWQLRRHVELQERPWARLAPGARALVERVFAGDLPSPCGNATQFCSTATYYHDRHGRRPSPAEHEAFTEAWARDKNYEWARVAGADPRANCFFVERRFASLPAGVVIVEAPARR